MAILCAGSSFGFYALWPNLKWCLWPPAQPTGIGKFQVDERRDIEYLLSEVVSLPSLPATVTKMMELMEDENVALAEVGHVISADPAIALRTLRLVNSAYYGVGQKVLSVEHAVAMLGSKVIRNLVCAAAVFDTLSSATECFAKHSVACGVAMRIVKDTVGEACTIELDEEAFVFGLLHDVGKIVFEAFMSKEFNKVMEASRMSEMMWYELEREIIGVDHAEMGARLCENWNLPEELIEAVKGHHDLSVCDGTDSRASAATLHIADYVCCTNGYAGFVSNSVNLSDEALDTVNLNRDDVDFISQRFLKEKAGIEELLKLSA